MNKVKGIVINGHLMKSCYKVIDTITAYSTKEASDFSVEDVVLASDWYDLDGNVHDHEKDASKLFGWKEGDIMCVWFSNIFEVND